MALSFEEARKLLAQEEAVLTAYNIMLVNAQEYFEANSVSSRSEEDQIMFRKVAVCDHRRLTQPPGTPYMTDDEIISRLQSLDEKYEKEKDNA